MKSINLAIWIMVAVLFLCACPVLGTIYFDDGLTHDIDYSIYDNVFVDYQTPYMYTTVNWLDGNLKDPYSLNGYGHSRINISGGYIVWLFSHDSSRVSVSGGYIPFFSSYNSSQADITSGSTWNLRSYDSSKIYIFGGTVSWLTSHDSSQVNISGGLIENDLHSRESSQVNISGGSMHGSLHSYYSSQVNISGGSINSFVSYHSSRVNISGGSMGYLGSRDSSRVDISGGSIDSIRFCDSSQVDISGGSIGSELYLTNQALLIINGSDFAVDGQPFGFGELTSIYGGRPSDEPVRHLTGTLLSGELIDNDFRIGYDARIVLVPEPATVLLLGFGAAVFLRRRRN